MKQIRQVISLRIPTRLLKLVKILATNDNVSINEEINRLIEFGIKTYMDKSVKNEDLILNNN